MATKQQLLELGRLALVGSTTRYLLVVVLWFGVSLPVFAESLDDSAAIRTHLEFLGYTVTPSDGYLQARHSDLADITIGLDESGMSMFATFTWSEYLKTRPEAQFRLVNKFNMATTHTKFAVDDDGDLLVFARYQGPYSRQSFGFLVQTFNSEIERVFTRFSAEMDGPQP
jgi:hypothetical protein